MGKEQQRDKCTVLFLGKAAGVAIVGMEREAVLTSSCPIAMHLARRSVFVSLSQVKEMKKEN